MGYLLSEKFWETYDVIIDALWCNFWQNSENN